jgi:diacylglycerol kinase (ATP)
MKANKPFSIKSRIMSFKYALNGILQVIKSQHNAWIHLAAAVSVLLAGLWLGISATEWVAVILSTGMVLSAEAFNTAIELLVDKISPQQNPIAGKIKDVAAAAVLFVAGAAAIVGLIIFVPKLMELLP